MRGLPLRSTLLFLAVVVMGSAAAPTLAAQTEDDGWITTSSDPLVNLDHLIPGSVRTSTFEVHNPRNQPVRFTFRTIDVVDDDGGCNHPEELAGDESCGAGGGELQHDLVVRLLTVDADGTDRLLDEGTLHDLEDRWLEDDVELEAGAARTYVLEHELPRSTTNLTQTDQVGFDLEMALAAVNPSAQVAGVSISRDDVTRISGARLAATGGSLRLPALAALLAVGGVVALGLGRRAPTAAAST